MAERNGTRITPSAGNWPDQRAGQYPGSYYQNELGKLLPEPFPPPFPEMPAPSLERLSREYVAGGGWAWYGQVARTLPNAIDDVSADFGDDIYERMMFDPQVAAVAQIFKASILESGLTLTSAVRSRSEPDYELAAEIAAEAEHMMAEFDGALDDILYNLLDCVALGNKVAEQTYRMQGARKDGRKILVIDKLKVRPRRATVFAVDIYLNLVGLLIRVPPNASPWSSTMMFGPQDEPFNLLPPHKFVITNFRMKDNDPRGTALDPITPIPTPDGWRTMDDLQPGDKVFDEEGRIRYVTARKDWEDRPCWEIEFRGGEKIVADENHQWQTHTAYERYGKREPKIRTTKEIVATLRNEHYSGVRSPNGVGRANHSIAWARPLDYPEQVLPVHPYYLGLWLGDGTARTADISCDVKDLDETVALIGATGYSARGVQNGKSDGNGRLIRVGGDKKWDSTGPTHGLRFLHVSWDQQDNKHIPEAYLRGSIQQRRDLLAGLMDSDGTVDRDGRCEFVNTNRQLVEGVAELARSLGVPAIATLRKRATTRMFPGGREHQTKDAWGAHFTPPWSPFKLSRKSAKALNGREQRQHYIIGAREVPNRRTVCIETDGPSHLYLAGRAMIPTHNSLLRPAYAPWWRKQQIIPEYLKYLSQFAGPSIYGIVGPNATPQPNGEGGQVTAEQVLVAALQSFRNGTAAAFAFGTEIQTIMMQGDGAAFLRALDHCDQQITKAVLTQELATEEGKHMARAAAEVHQDVLDTLVRQGKHGFARQFRNQLFKRWVSYNWGDEAVHLAPRVGLGTAILREQPALWTSVAQMQNAHYLAPSQYQAIDQMVGLPVRDETELVPLGIDPADPPVATPNNDGGEHDQTTSQPQPTNSDQAAPFKPAKLPDRPKGKSTRATRDVHDNVGSQGTVPNSRGDVPGVTGTTPQAGGRKRGRAPGQRPAPGARKGVYSVAEPSSSGLPSPSPHMFASVTEPPQPQEVRVQIGFDKPKPVRVKFDRNSPPETSAVPPPLIRTEVVRDKQGRITGTVQHQIEP